MSKDQRKIARQKKHDIHKALRLGLKDESVRQLIIATQKQYYKMGYEKGYSDGKSTEVSQTVS